MRREQFTRPADASGPLMPTHGGPGPHLVLRWRELQQTPAALDLVVHFHGYAPKREMSPVPPSEMDLARWKEPHSGLDFDERPRAALGILPRGRFFGGDSGAGYSFPDLTRPANGLQRLLDFSRSWYQQHVLGMSADSPPLPGRLILTAHSGGGAAVSFLLGSHAARYAIDEVHLYDSTYGGENTIVEWARARMRDTSRGQGALRVYYLANTRTQAGAHRIRDGLQRALAGAPSNAGTFFRVDTAARGVSHGQVPSHYGPRLHCDPAWTEPSSSRAHGLSEGGCSVEAEAGEVAGAQALSTPPKPTRDQIIAEYDRSNGTGFRNVAGWRAQMVPARIFGVSVGGGVHPSFLPKLQAAETEATRLVRAAGHTGTIDWGVYSIGGYQDRNGMHGFGLAVDINYDGAPYILNEAGEAKLDEQLSSVYDRIARLMVGRDSVIPRQIRSGARSTARTSELYDRLLEESDGMRAYFRAMLDTTQAQLCIAAHPEPSFWHVILGRDGVPDVTTLRAQMAQDYVTLSGRAGPSSPGLTYPSAPNVAGAKGDRPFSGGSASRRAPELGFLPFRKELVMGLAQQGLRWGAVDFGRPSGDVMHFDDRLGTVGRALERAEAAAVAAAARSSSQAFVPAALHAPGAADAYDQGHGRWAAGTVRA